MSGCGRKHRAKHLTRQFLDADGWKGPAAGESMAVCIESPQSQHVRVLLFGSNDNGDNTIHSNVNSDINDDNNSGMVPTECVVFVPGKFRKVIWLAVKDIIVVADGTTVSCKPSPEQLKTFFRENPEWKQRLLEAQEKVETCRRAVERQPQYAKTVQTTTSVLAKVGEEKESSDAVTAAVGEEERGDWNPNRNNIRHKAQFFYDSEEEEEEEEEVEEEEEDDEKEEEEES